jgi:hypothetical protein
MAAAFPLEPPNQDSASASKSDKLLEQIVEHRLRHFPRHSHRLHDFHLTEKTFFRLPPEAFPLLCFFLRDFLEFDQHLPVKFRRNLPAKFAQHTIPHTHQNARRQLVSTGG